MRECAALRWSLRLWYRAERLSWWKPPHSMLEMTMTRCIAVSWHSAHHVDAPCLAPCTASTDRLLRLQEHFSSHLSSWSTDCACQGLAYTDAGTLQMVKGDPAMEDVYEWTAKQINVPFRGRTGILNPSAVAPFEILTLACGGHMGFPCRSAHCIEATM
jgi:hypothetical protein